jgi:hypothetical protein
MQAIIIITFLIFWGFGMYCINSEAKRATDCEHRLSHYEERYEYLRND